MSYQAHPSVLGAWLAVYREPGTHWDLYELAEELLDLEDAMRQWRLRHVTTVERIIGLNGHGRHRGGALPPRAPPACLVPRAVAGEDRAVSDLPTTSWANRGDELLGPPGAELADMLDAADAEHDPAGQARPVPRPRRRGLPRRQLARPPAPHGASRHRRGARWLGDARCGRPRRGGAPVGPPTTENIRETIARLVGARAGEAVVMNSLTVNLHVMLGTFYQADTQAAFAPSSRPTSSRRTATPS